MPSRLMLRITAPVFLGSFGLLTLGVGTAWYVHDLQKEISEQLAKDLDSWRIAQGVTLAIRDIRNHLNRFIVRGLPEELNEIPRLYQDVLRGLDQGEELTRTAGEGDLIRRVRVGSREFYASYQEILQMEKPPSAQAIRLLMDEKLIPEVWTDSHDYLELTMEAALQTSQKDMVLDRWMVLGLMLLGSCGAVAGLLAGYGIARGIRGRLVQLAVPIRDAAGKLSTVVGPVTVAVSKSFADLQQLLERMADHVGEVVERLNQSQRQALRAEQLAAVGQLAAGIAHELRNPLTAMKILVQSGTERPGGTLRSRDLAVLEEEISRLEKLISTFLDFARPPQLDKHPLDLRSAVEPVVTLFRAKAEPVGVSIVSDLASEPVRVEADAGQMRQLLLNLLLNALDACREGSRIEVEVGSAVDGTAVLRVSDTGRGLPSELGERIFDPFVSTKETGIGLGLSICKRIVEAHGGTITASDRTDGGAVFTVNLPRGQGPGGRGLSESSSETDNSLSLETGFALTPES